MVEVKFDVWKLPSVSTTRPTINLNRVLTATALTVAWLTFWLPTAAVAESDSPTSQLLVNPAQLDQARTASSLLGSRLGSRLKAALQEGGPVAAVDVCHLEAQDISLALSAELAVSVKRTALKVRNPLNSPDPWERMQLERFEAAIASGDSASSLEAIEYIAQPDGELSLRYMKPIMTQGLCLACHGNSIASEVAAAIRQRYPEDEATGFDIGAMRGAFSIILVPNHAN